MMPSKMPPTKRPSFMLSVTAESNDSSPVPSSPPSTGEWGLLCSHHHQPLYWAIENKTLNGDWWNECKCQIDQIVQKNQLTGKRHLLMRAPARVHIHYECTLLVDTRTSTSVTIFFFSFFASDISSSLLCRFSQLTIFNYILFALSPTSSISLYATHAAGSGVDSFGLLYNV